MHYRLLTEPTYISPCDINATFNCSQVYLSRYGSVAGVPVALGGLFWFALVALIAAFTRPGSHGVGRPRRATSFALSTIGLAVVLYLGYASFFVLKTGCVLCIGTYVAVIGIFIASGLAASLPMTSVCLPRSRRDVQSVAAKPATALAAILLAGRRRVGRRVLPAGRFGAVGVGGRASGVQRLGRTDERRRDFAAAWAQQPRVDLGIPADGAKVIVVKFNDWQCPSCSAAHQAYKPVLDEVRAVDRRAP